jgi:hypothetical protein
MTARAMSMNAKQRSAILWTMIGLVHMCASCQPDAGGATAQAAPQAEVEAQSQTTSQSRLPAWSTAKIQAANRTEVEARIKASVADAAEKLRAAQQPVRGLANGLALQLAVAEEELRGKVIVGALHDGPSTPPPLQPRPEGKDELYMPVRYAEEWRAYLLKRAEYPWVWTFRITDETTDGTLNQADVEALLARADQVLAAFAR